MSKSSSADNESERLPPIVLLLVGVLAGLLITALIFCFLAYKLKFCKKQQNERKSSIQVDKTDGSGTAIPGLLLARNSTVESLATSEKWRTGYTARNGSVDVLCTSDHAVKAVGYSLASNNSECFSNDLILRVGSQNEPDEGPKCKTEVVEATFDPGYPNNSILSNPSIA